MKRQWTQLFALGLVAATLAAAGCAPKEEMPSGSSTDSTLSMNDVPEAIAPSPDTAIAVVETPQPGATTTTTTTTTTSTIPAPTVASFTFSPVTPQVLQVVNFDASGSTPGTGRTIVRYEWDFGDGVKKNGVMTNHDYKVTGLYLVTLTVIDDADQKAKLSQTITVRPVGP